MTGRAIPLALVATALCAQSPYRIGTVAGTGVGAFGGDDGPASNAFVNHPEGVFVGSKGVFYIADQKNHRIRKVDGLIFAITPVAGNGQPGYSGDGGAATSAELNSPTGICVDEFGNIYIADSGNHRIRRVSPYPYGIISTVAGTGSSGFAGDGGPAINATLNNPTQVKVDRSGNLLIADGGNHRIRRIDVNGVITTVAGNGVGAFSGDGGPATAASLNNPTDIAIDQTGVIYIADRSNQRIRRVGSDGIISTIAGNGVAGFSGDGGPGTSAALNYPGAVAVDGLGSVYIADDANFRIRRTSSGFINTIAGNGTKGFSGDGGPATSASLSGNFGIAVGINLSLYVADADSNRVRILTVSPPNITSAAFVNAASYITGGSPGGIATLFGSGLAIYLSGIQQNSGVPLGPAFGGVSVMVNGKPAFIFNAVNLNGAEQISFQIPVDTVPGPATVTVDTASGSASITVNITSEQPGIFTVEGTRAAALHADGTLIDSNRPAAPGETIAVFCTGLGAVSPPVATGFPARATTLSPTIATYRATVAGQNAPIAFSGLAPNLVALYQVNLTVPVGTPSGLQDLVLTSSNNAVSNAVKLTVR